MLFSLFFDCLKKKKVSENNSYPCFLLPILTFPYLWFLLQNETLFLFLKSNFFLKWDYGNYFSVLLFKWDLSFLYLFILSGVFCFFHLDAEKTEEREGKEFDKSRIFFGLFCSRERNRVFFLTLCLQV